MRSKPATLANKNGRIKERIKVGGDQNAKVVIGTKRPAGDDLKRIEARGTKKLKPSDDGWYMRDWRAMVYIVVK
jgi:hypothetical protein